MLQLQIIGNLIKDAEMRIIGIKDYLAFPVAVNANKHTAVFVNVRKRFSEGGSQLQQYLTKGKKVFVQGQMSVQVYNRQDGTPSPDITIWATNIELLSSKEEGGQNNDPFEQ